MLWWTKLVGIELKFAQSDLFRTIHTDKDIKHFLSKIIHTYTHVQEIKPEATRVSAERY